MPVTKEDLVWDGDEDESDLPPLQTGRSLFKRVMRCGLNKMPIQILQGYIVRNPQPSEGLPVHPFTLTGNMLIESGPTLITLDNVNGWVIQENMLPVCAEDALAGVLALQGVMGENHVPLTREYRRGDKKIIITDYKNYHTDSQEKVGTAVYRDPDTIIVYENIVCPEGLLFPAQRLLLELEQRAGTKHILSEESVGSTWFVNYGGSDAKLRQTIRARSVNNIVPRNTQIIQGGGSNLYPQVLQDEDGLRADYYAMMYLNYQDTLSRVSGVAMQYSLTPQINFIDAMRDEVRAVYKAMGYSGEVHFDKIVIMSSQERNELLNLYTLAQAALVAAGQPLEAAVYAELIKGLL